MHKFIKSVPQALFEQNNLSKCFRLHEDAETDGNTENDPERTNRGENKMSLADVTR